MATSQYVLVHLLKSHDSSFIPAKFVDSVLDVLCGGSDEGSVYAQVQENRLMLSKEPQFAQHESVRIKRPSFCPVHHISSEQANALPEKIQTRGINSGAATLLETSDGKVLLTRRAQHLRTFPGVWVPPGGHIESGESFQAAALREMKEEVGLEFSPEDMTEVKQVALWESVFPTKLSIGLPQRHHIVCYIHAKLWDPLTAEALTPRIKLDPAEVGACAWMDRQMVEAIVSASEEGESTFSEEAAKKLPETFTAQVVDPSGSLHEEQISSAILTRVCDGEAEQPDVERVSTGTKFALSRWLDNQSRNHLETSNL